MPPGKEDAGPRSLLLVSGNKSNLTWPKSPYAVADLHCEGLSFTQREMVLTFQIQTATIIIKKVF